jgi:hypothetical protein
VNGEIGLAVALEVEGSEHYTTRYWPFENSRRYWIAVAHDDPGQTYVDRDEFRVRSHIDLLFQ